jgi:ABC-type lipoprotein release transport system permease subunit
VFVVRLTHTAPRNTAFAELSREFPSTVLGPLLPPDIENLRRVDGPPTLLVGLVDLVDLVALATIGHGLVVSVRHRRRDLAILRSMGFLGREVSALVAWQVTAVVVIGLVVGVPIGIVTGRCAWTLVTNQLGLPRSTAVSALLALGVPVALIAANAIAFIPGRTASRMRLSSVLRAE